MAYTKKIWVDVPDPSNLPDIPQGQDSLARFDKKNMNRIEEGIEDAHALIDGLMASSLHNLGYMAEHQTILGAATAPNTAGYTFFAVQGSPLFYAEDSAFKSNEVQYLVLFDERSVGIRRTVIAYSYTYNTIKMRKIYNGAWHNEDWYSIVTEGQTVDNSDMVDGLHSYNLATLSEAGTSHGTAYPMFCQHNLRGKYRFDISVKGFEVGVDHATTADRLTRNRSELVSYVGTGKSGIDNPCFLTFDFAPKIIIFVGYSRSGRGYAKLDQFIITDLLTTEYKADSGFHNDSTYYGNQHHAKKTEDGKTVYWYTSYATNEAPELQCNALGYTYYFYAIE